MFRFHRILRRRIPISHFLDFAIATEPNLEGLAMIAGMWSDIRTDRNSTDGIYLVQPDIDRVIFRWQGVTFSTETPVNFEIELRRDGSIHTRYGSGNSSLNPVIVGISGGDPDAYLVRHALILEWTTEFDQCSERVVCITKPATSAHCGSLGESHEQSASSFPRTEHHLRGFGH